MDQQHLSKLYSSVGIVALVIAVNTWIQIQGGETILSMPLLSKEHPAAALYGLVLVGALLALTAIVGLVHAMRHGTCWHERAPLVWLAGLRTGTAEGRLFQAALLILLIALPAISLVKFWDAVMTARLCALGNSAEPQLVADSWWAGIAGNPSQTCLVTGLLAGKDGAAASCGGGIEVFPPKEFLAIMLLDIFAAACVCAFLVALFRPSAMPSTGPLDSQ